MGIWFYYFKIYIAQGIVLYAVIAFAIMTLFARLVGHYVYLLQEGVNITRVVPLQEWKVALLFYFLIFTARQADMLLAMVLGWGFVCICQYKCK